MQPFSKFLLQLVILSVVLLAAEWIVFEFVLHKPLTVSFYIPFVYFIALLTFIHNLLLKASSKDPKQFVPIFMGMIGLKMFASIVFIFIYLYLYREEGRPWVISFTILHFCYTALEIVSILKASKK